MADKANRFPMNAAGKYYCDSQCIDCGMCRETCPDVFVRCDEEGHSYVKRQPATPQEEELCQEALGNCPAGAIGDDGE